MTVTSNHGVGNLSILGIWRLLLTFGSDAVACHVIVIVVP
jgi:hypothetical protein